MRGKIPLLSPLKHLGWHSRYSVGIHIMYTSLLSPIGFRSCLLWNLSLTIQFQFKDSGAGLAIWGCYTADLVFGGDVGNIILTHTGLWWRSTPLVAIANWPCEAPSNVYLTLVAFRLHNYCFPAVNASENQGWVCFLRTQLGRLLSTRGVDRHPNPKWVRCPTTCPTSLPKTKSFFPWLKSSF